MPDPGGEVFKTFGPGTCGKDPVGDCFDNPWLGSEGEDFKTPSLDTGEESFDISWLGFGGEVFENPGLSLEQDRLSGKVGVTGLTSGTAGSSTTLSVLADNSIFGFLDLFMPSSIKEEINEMADIPELVSFTFNAPALDLLCSPVKLFNAWESSFSAGFSLNSGIFLCTIDNFVNWTTGFWGFGTNGEAAWGNLTGDWGSCDLVGGACNEGTGDCGDFPWRLVDEILWGTFTGDWGTPEGLKRLLIERSGEKKEESDWLVSALDRTAPYIKIPYIRNHAYLFI